jgi:hypothetical protein
VSVRADWISSEYPGAASCQLVVVGTAGEEVGSLPFELNSATDGLVNGPMIVPVSGTPASASGTCDQKALDVNSGPGYVFTNTGKREAVDTSSGKLIPNLTTLAFDVKWAGPGEPNFRTCYLNVTRTDGTTDTPIRNNVLASEGTATYDVEGSPDSIASATMDCQPFTG